MSSGPSRISPNGKQTPSLRIHGRIEEGWNYANSNPVPMAAGKLYRLSAWVRVDRVGPGTPMPYLKCEFQSADRNARARPGQHRSLRRCRSWASGSSFAASSAAPDGTQSCWLALEKGTDAPDRNRRLPGGRSSGADRAVGFWDTYRLKPIPPALEKVRGVHPRIYLTQRADRGTPHGHQDHARRDLEEGPGPGRPGGAAGSSGLCAARPFTAATSNFGSARWETPCRCWRWPTS